MALEVYLDGELKLTRGGPFYAIRIGTHPLNDVVIRSDAEGVHEQHCTIVYTGSTYRLEMMPNHVVDIDGRPAEYGQQLFVQHNSSECALSIGGAPQKGQASPYPPPVIKLKRADENVDAPPSVKYIKRQRKNLTPGWQVRGQLHRFALGFLGIVGLLAASIWLVGDASAKRSERIAKRFETLAFSTAPSPEVTTKAKRSVMQVGLVKDGRFAGFGTAWVWNVPPELQGPQDAPGLDPGHRLVTNRHVWWAIKECAASPAGCQGVAQGCAAVRYVSLDAGGIASQARIEKLDPACGESGGELRAKTHPHYSEFDGRFDEDARPDVPNIYDVAIAGWPQALQDEFMIPGFDLAAGAEVGEGVGSLGVPVENYKNPSPVAQYRVGTIGRMTDPFGLPGDEQDYLLITGGAVEGGDSGGPVINGKGEVVAMQFAGFFVAGAAVGINRLDYGDKFRALSSRLVAETLTLQDEQKLTAVETKRHHNWEVGLAPMLGDYTQSLMARRAMDSCNVKLNANGKLDDAVSPKSAFAGRQGPGRRSTRPASQPFPAPSTGASAMQARSRSISTKAQRRATISPSFS